MHKLPLILLVASCLSNAAFAAPPASEDHALDSRSGLDAYLSGEYLLGGGETWRKRLKEDVGIEPFLFYTNNIAGNPVGGRDEGNFTYVDDFWFGLRFDLEKLLGWRGGNFTISGVNRDGRSLTNEYIGSQFQSQQLYGGQTIFLYQFVFEQWFLENKVSLKLGRFGASDDFNSSPVYGMYMTNAINGNVRNVLFNTQFSAYPFATWAVRLRVDPTREFNFQIGAFQTWEDIFDPSHHGLDWGFHSGDSVFLITQIGWTPEFVKKPVPSESSREGKNPVSSPEMKGLPGHYWIGATYTPWEGFPQFGRPLNEKAGDSYGFYVHADQMVYQERPGSSEGLILWAASGYYPQENISIMPFQVNGGLIYEGLIPGRNKDRTTLGVAYGRFSRDYAGSIKAAGGGDPRYEMVLEVGHRIQFTRFAYIQPVAQWFIRPGGTGNIPDAFIVGAQMGLTF